MADSWILPLENWQALLALHSRETRFWVPGYEEWSYLSPEDAFDATSEGSGTWKEADQEARAHWEAYISSFDICRHCGDLETDHNPEASFERSLWPCPTMKALGEPAR